MRDGSGAWQPVGRLDTVADGAAWPASVDGRALLVFRRGGAACAVDAVCPHRGARLDTTLAAERYVVCPAHGWAFDVTTGRNRVFRAAPLAVHATRVVDGEVLVRRSALARLSAWWRGRARGSPPARG